MFSSTTLVAIASQRGVMPANFQLTASAALRGAESGETVVYAAVNSREMQALGREAGLGK